MFKLVTNNTDILNNSNNLSWSSDIDTLGTQISFDTIKNLEYGQVVSLWETDTELIRGIVKDKTAKKNTFNYVVQDYSFYLKNKTLKQFNNLAASECIKELVKDAYIVGNITDIPTIITKIYKDKTLDEIISDILETAEYEQGVKYVKDITGNVMSIQRLENMKIVPNVIVGEFEIKGNIDNMKNDIQVISNEESVNVIVASASDESKWSWYGKLSDTISVESKDVANSKNIAINKLANINKIEKSTTVPLVILDETVQIKANRLMYFHNDILIGYYRIKSAKHSLSDGLHKCEVDIILDEYLNALTSSYENQDAINTIISLYNSQNSSSSNTSTNSNSSSADLSNSTEISMNLSFYTGAADEGGNESASGKTLQYGMCASNVYSFGTQFYIKGIQGLDDGTFTVEDRGGSDFNSSNRLDIYVGNDSDSKAKANNLGRQTVTAYKLS